MLLKYILVLYKANKVYVHNSISSFILKPFIVTTCLKLLHKQLVSIIKCIAIEFVEKIAK